MWPKNGLKAQKLIAQGNTLGIVAVSKAPCKGKSFVTARRPGGFAIRRKKRFDPLKLGDL